MKDLIDKGTALAAANAGLLATTATLIGAFNNKDGALLQLLTPMYCFLGGMLLGGLLTGGGILLNWTTRTTTSAEATFARGVFWGVIWVSGIAATAGCVSLVLALTAIASI